jgi:hypothetical protein
MGLLSVILPANLLPEQRPQPRNVPSLLVLLEMAEQLIALVLKTLDAMTDSKGSSRRIVALEVFLLGMRHVYTMAGFKKGELTTTDPAVDARVGSFRFVARLWFEFVFEEVILVSGKTLRIFSITHPELQALIRNAHFQLRTAGGESEDPATLARRLLAAITGSQFADVISPAMQGQDGDADTAGNNKETHLDVPSVRKLDAIISDPASKSMISSLRLFVSKAANIALQFRSPLALAYVELTDAWVAATTTPNTASPPRNSLVYVRRGSLTNNVVDY